MAADSSRSAGPADSYIGSLISLTSKSEIRYEGVLYNINTEESSIGLRNVRSFGTEGRKKDGPQVLPSDKVYEYILFRGSDIKDLQVKSSPPVQTPPTIHEDPAIIQSHYSRPASLSTSLPPVASGSVADMNSHTSQLGLPRSTFPGGLPLYQPPGNLGSWGSSPPNANGGGLAMPTMYWPGYYGHPSGLQHVQQQPLLRPPPGLSMPHPMQQPMQYTGMNASLPMGTSSFPSLNLPSSTLSELPPLLPPVTSGALNLTSTLSSALPSTLAPAHTAALVSETSPSVMPNKVPATAPSSMALSSSLPVVSSLTTSSDVNVIAPPNSNKPKTVSGPSLPYPAIPQSVPTVGGASSSSYTEVSTPALITPGQLLQPGSTSLSTPQASQTSHKDVEVVQATASEPPLSTPEVHAPILPLPTPHEQKLNGAPTHTRNNYSYRGRGRGRGNGILHPVTKFTEEFDFMAMNEKFNKDEVWGHLGKSNKSRDKQGDGSEEDEDDLQDEDYAGSSTPENKPVYVKDDFFDTLSCNALDHASRGGRTRFSEQRKIDTETFGDFPRQWGGRGGRGPGRGGRSRGPYYGRGYGYAGRGRGQTMSGRFN
ncbi:decapping [Thalictrum thalictroides]|uniref:Decapping n=1 Tax=Thalictrum thalictroides TaxID=46969 RepID=A0A7J6W7Q3_THATH|nr:decapping [Thalictrum thalictroides]